MSKKPIEQIQNRAQRRKAEKVLKTGKKSKEEMNRIIDVMNAISGFDVSDLPKFKECLLEGDRVKLNYNRIKSHKSYDSYRPEYKAFVEAAGEDTIFTVEYDKGKTDKPSLVVLREDITDPKWLFCDVDLLVEHKGIFRELYSITIEDEQ
jgi:hypothetical protein